MRNLVAAAVLALTFAACASGPPKPKFVAEKNQAKFATTKELSAKPENVRIAARAVLDDLTRASSPEQASDSVKADDDAIFTGWVYSPESRDKYIDYDYNGTTQHKTLEVRRIYGYTISPSLAGSRVKLNVEEEVQDLDLKTGEPKGWKRVDADTATYDMLYRKLREQLTRM